jgi:hypothetical protein
MPPATCYHEGIKVDAEKEGTNNLLQVQGLIGAHDTDIHARA